MFIEIYYLFAIPQTLPEDFEIEVTYRVFTADSKLEAQTAEALPEIETEEGRKGSLVTNVISVKEFGNLTKLEAGTQYKFNIILGMTSVQLDVDVDDWKDPEIEKDAWFNENTDI